MNNNGETNNTNLYEEPVLLSVEDEGSTDEDSMQPATEPVNTISSEYQYNMPVESTPANNTAIYNVPIPTNTDNAVVAQQPVANQEQQVVAEQPQPDQEEKPLSKKELKRQQKEQAKQDKINQKKAEEEARRQAKIAKEEAKKASIQKRSPFMYTLLLLAVIVLAGYVFYSGKVYQSRISQLKYACTPITTNKKEEKLDINSTLVQQLYSKVVTNVKEDYASPEWDNNMKLYLAYRQIPTNEKYESNCNMFNSMNMEPYYCEVTSSYAPHAFKEESLILQFKKLFGEDTPLQLGNVKLQNGCIGGYEYIPERKEFVEGICSQQITTPIRVKKQLREAISHRNTIILIEDVKYTGSDKVEMPSYLKSGTYYYTFRLDMNYNFVLISKTYEDMY